MNIFQQINQNIQDIFNPVNLKLATVQSLHASEAIKDRVRVKLDKLTEEQKEVAAYADLLIIHDKIEKNHDVIYQRPNTGVNPRSAKDDCIKIVFTQEELENSFNLKYAEITLDPVVLEENATLQAERKIRDVKDAAEHAKVEAINAANQVAADAKEQSSNAKDMLEDEAHDAKDAVQQIRIDAIVKAKEVAADAKEHAADAHETITDRVQDFGQRVGNAVEDVKEAFTSSKPRI